MQSYHYNSRFVDTNKAGPGLCGITSCTSGLANKKCKSPRLVSDLNCFPYAPNGIYDPAGARRLAPHFSGSSTGRFRKARICEKAGSSQLQPTLHGSPFPAVGALGLISEGLKSASFMFLQIIICWGSLQNFSLSSALQTQLSR